MWCNEAPHCILTLCLFDLFVNDLPTCKHYEDCELRVRCHNYGFSVPTLVCADDIVLMASYPN